MSYERDNTEPIEALTRHSPPRVPTVRPGRLEKDQWNPLAVITIIAWFVSGPLGGIVFGWIALGRIDRRGGRGRAQIIAILSISYAIVIIATALFTLKLISSYGGTLSAPD